MDSISRTAFLASIVTLFTAPFVKGKEKGIINTTPIVSMPSNDGPDYQSLKDFERSFMRSIKELESKIHPKPTISKDDLEYILHKEAYKRGKI
jgi:hypothetical protein